MQGVAASLRQSETAFLLERPEGWLLRWFTPRCEVPLCGHATLAALLALAHWRTLEPGQTVQFHSRSGALEASLPCDQPGWGSIVLPSSGLTPTSPPLGLSSLLREQLGSDCLAFWSSELGYQVALLPEEAPLGAMEAPGDRLEGDLRRGLVLMQSISPAAAGPQISGARADYQLRFFAPGLGIPEDPVTGSAHALVAPWWQQRFGRPIVRGWQCSDRPGGMLCEATSSGMIRLTGSGHLLWDGTLRTASGGCAAERPEGSPPGESEQAADWSEWQTATHWPYSIPSGAIPS